MREKWLAHVPDYRRADAHTAGRLGVAISALAGYGGSGGGLNEDERRRLIIDPATGNVLAAETVLMQAVAWLDGKPGDITGSITILDQGWVNSVDRQPRSNG